MRKPTTLNVCVGSEDKRHKGGRNTQIAIIRIKGEGMSTVSSHARRRTTHCLAAEKVVFKKMEGTHMQPYILSVEKQTHNHNHT